MNFAETIGLYNDLAPGKLAKSTVDTYRTWIKKYLAFLRTPEARVVLVSERKFELFLGEFAEDDYARATQDQAFNAVLWLYKHVYQEPLREVDALRCRANPRERYIPTREEVAAMLKELKKSAPLRIRVAVALMYGCGLRISEVIALRIKDVDFVRMSLTIQASKGDKSRQVEIPKLVVPLLQKWMENAKDLAAIDIRNELPVQVPGRFAISRPRWPFMERWHFLFPSDRPCVHPRTKNLVRWHISDEMVRRYVTDAAAAGGVEGVVTPHALRGAFCTHLLDAGKSVRRVQEAMGHTDIRTTAKYARKECLGMGSPLDAIAGLLG